ncbi:MAG: efflux RND transporter periplasmic adaptor subunit [Chloroflexota bacterium]|nr:efflux RND transporter periplasmic adaptor subunit [Chloroflexota bacterium]
MRRTIFTILGTVLVIALIAGGFFGYRFYDSSAHYVSSENALVLGDIVHVATMNPGRVDTINVEVGDSVRQGETLATVDVPVASGLGLSIGGNGPIQGTMVSTALVSPLTGVVVAKRTTVGDSVTAGQPVVSVVDLGKLWVVANVDESQINRVAVGQPVDVHVDMLDKNFKGTVIAITPATASTFFAPPASSATSDFTKVGQLVPVKIALDYADSILFPGASAEVSIKVS